MTIDPTAVANAAREWAETVKLDTLADFDTAVREQLMRVNHMSVTAKRHATIRAMAEAEIRTDISRDSLFSRKDVISKSIFYRQDKDWFHDPLFREVLERVIAIYRRWDSTKELRQMLERQREWREKALDIGHRMADKGLEMMEFPLHDVEVDTESGTAVLKPARWTLDTVPRLATAADKLVRMALDMATDKTETDLTTDGEKMTGPVFILPPKDDSRKADD